MLTTSVNLLQRMQEPADQEAWNRFVMIYTPVLYQWSLHAGFTDTDAGDLVQDVLTILVRELPRFRYIDSRSSFRRWLKTVTLNKCREQQRKRQITLTLDLNAGLDEATDNEGLEAGWDAEYHQSLAAHALKIMQQDFEETTWRACWEHVVSGRSAAEVGQELGLSEGAVYVAKSRVLKRLRQELEGLWE